MSSLWPQNYHVIATTFFVKVERLRSPEFPIESQITVLLSEAGL